MAPVSDSLVQKTRLDGYIKAGMYIIRTTSPQNTSFLVGRAWWVPRSQTYQVCVVTRYLDGRCLVYYQFTHLMYANLAPATGDHRRGADLGRTVGQLRSAGVLLVQLQPGPYAAEREPPFGAPGLLRIPLGGHELREVRVQYIEYIEMTSHRMRLPPLAPPPPRPTMRHDGGYRRSPKTDSWNTCLNK
jgi:hypothetical protein